MKNFILLVSLFLAGCNICRTQDVNPTSFSLKDKRNASDYPPLCDTPPSASNIDPETCCKFPKIFDDSVMEGCERENGVNNKSLTGDLITDSCLIECMFNKSGLNNASKLHREEMIKMTTIKTKNDSVWTPLVTKAIDTCFNEFSDDDMSEIVEHMKKEVVTNHSSIANKICYPLTSLLLDCFYRELFKICPKEKFTASNDCNILKNYTITCDDW